MMSVKRREADREEARATSIPPKAIERAVQELPVYTREELEAKLEGLDEIIGDIGTHFANIEEELRAIAKRVFDAHVYGRPPWRVLEFHDEVEGEINNKIEDILHR
jgi:S-methylmethionine-dependent homocysteine/selenocysteine methylase